MDIDTRFRDAVQHYWTARSQQRQKQEDHGRIDAGTRGAVTGGYQMGALEVLVSDVLGEVGFDRTDIRTRTALELPGYFRPEKKWDLLVVSRERLVVAIEFKSQVGPSFGNNFNNRCEEAIGNAVDILTAFREGRLGDGPKPLLGYFFLLEDSPAVHRPVKTQEPYFDVDPVFKGATYAMRYEILCRRLVLERLYDTACLTLSTHEANTRITHPSEDLSINRFIAQIQGCAFGFLQSLR